MAHPNSFGTRATLSVGDTDYRIFRLDAIAGASHLPFSLKILLENMLRHEDGHSVTGDDIEALANWDSQAQPSREIAFAPARILMQDFTGVPAVVDLAAMRDAIRDLGGDPSKVNPLIPAELVIDHSIIADVYGTPDAFRQNAELEFERNRERYRFLRWGQRAFRNLRVVPPNTGICHQVNLEYLARVVFRNEQGEAYPDTLLGTDSHTTMINGLGVLGWGVGGIEAEAAMLGQPVSMLIPPVVGFELTGALPEGSTATDLVLTITEMLRRHGVVGKFVEFHGEGVAAVPLANRATLGNMSPEYGSTCAMFPIDDETLRYLRLTGRGEDLVALVEAYAKEQGLWHEPSFRAEYSEQLSLDLSTVVPSIAGPARPQDRISLDQVREKYRAVAPASAPREVALDDGSRFEVDHGHVVIAAITSCTNTSNPEVMVGAGLLARNAVEKGLRSKPWVKTSLAPGSKVVMDYYERAGLVPYLEKLGFDLVGFGCTTCIGNSGPLLPPISEAIVSGDLTVAAVLSGNRNFEGRIHPEVRLNYLASPPLVVAYALAGTMDIDLLHDPLGTDAEGRPVYLADIWPSPAEVAKVIESSIDAAMFSREYASVFDGDERWRALEVPEGDAYEWDPASTYVRRPPYFEGMGPELAPLSDIKGARVLAWLGDSVTTDHISPAGNIRPDSPAGRWLADGGVEPADFNSYGSRRGNHEVMIRGTFANIRIRNKLVPETEGGFTRHLPADPDERGEVMSIYDAAKRYEAEGVPLVILAGKEYGSGSSRDWAAKGTTLLGVRAVLAESFERIHRSNLVGMGVLPLQFRPGESAKSLGLTGEELFDIVGVDSLPPEVTVTAGDRVFSMIVRIDTPKEREYFRHGGILPYVARQLVAAGE
jgi:aconitate hydratase